MFAVRRSIPLVFIRELLICVLVLCSALLVSAPVLAKKGKSEADPADTFLQLFQRWSQAAAGQNIEEEIAAAEATLKIAAGLREWPLARPLSRNSVKALLCESLEAAYMDRREGSEPKNIEKAIKANEAGLSVQSRDTNPAVWASFQHNLGYDYSLRIKGDRVDNLERAIAGFEAALTVFTREAFPKDFATAKENLANACIDRIPGDRAENIETAIELYKAALEVWTRKDFLEDWATRSIWRRPFDSASKALARPGRLRRRRNSDSYRGYYRSGDQTRTNFRVPRPWSNTV